MIFSSITKYDFKILFKRKNEQKTNKQTNEQKEKVQKMGNRSRKNFKDQMAGRKPSTYYGQRNVLTMHTVSILPLNLPMKEENLRGTLQN